MFEPEKDEVGRYGRLKDVRAEVLVARGNNSFGPMPSRSLTLCASPIFAKASRIWAALWPLRRTVAMKRGLPALAASSSGVSSATS